ncbi:MAG: septum formation initiator family protein [Clostridia bacterium]|nr:septum formation initiator family protein [Clostridia bacterium]
MKNEKTVKIISVICAVVSFVLVCVLIFQFVKIGNLQKKEEELTKHLNALEQQIVEYTNENNYIQSNEYLEDYAREVLGWGKENEMYFS